VYADKKSRTKAYLDGQRKVRYTIAKTSGQPPEYNVNINGCVYNVPIGVPVEIPEDVAAMLDERMASEGLLIRKSEETVKALEVM